jgi:hypothetical protein
MNRPHRGLWLAAAALAASAGLPRADERPAAVPVLAQGAWELPVHGAGGQPRERRTWAIRSEQELAKAAGANARAAVRRSLKVEAIDFRKQMILAVADGTLPMVGVSGGGPPSVPNRVEVARVAVVEDGKALLVGWRLAPRDPKDDIITHPLEVVLVERFDGEVRFERLPARADGAAPGKEVKPLARAFWPDGWRPEEPARQWVVRSRDELIDQRLKAPENVLERMRAEAAARYAKALKVAAVDFDKQMVVGVSAGVQPGPGYRVEVVGVEKGEKGEGLTVRWRLHAPAEAAEGAPTHPAAVALFGRTAGKVVFREEPRVTGP